MADATLPTPAQTPPTKHLGLPTPVADSYGDIFDLSKDVSADVPPPYTDKELQLALVDPPVQATLHYGSHILHGTLYYLPSLFFKLYERFLDISPSESPQLGDVDCEPWVLFNELQGRAWVGGKFLDRFGVNTAQQTNQEPRFVAVTDNFSVLMRAGAVEGRPSQYRTCSEEAAHTDILLANRLGAVSVNASLTLNLALFAHNDLIIALRSNRPFLGSRNAPLRIIGLVRPTLLPDAGNRAVPIKDYTPAPTSAVVLDSVQKILGAADDRNNISSGVPKKSWLTQNLSQHFYDSPINHPSDSRPAPSASPATVFKPQHRTTERHNTLSQSSPLWAHRGNEALFKRAVWQQLCYLSGQYDGNVEQKGGARLPDPYFQVLFEDLQGRERRQGSQELANVHRKWYVPELIDEGGWLGRSLANVARKEGRDGQASHGANANEKEEEGGDSVVS